MKFIKLTALASLLLSVFLISSCEKEGDVKKQNIYSQTNVVLSGAQVVPASTTSGTGLMSYSYDKRTKVLTYTVTWSQMTGSPTALGVYGLAPAGYAAATQIQVLSTSGLTASGTASNSLLADEVYIKEADLLNGQFYFQLRTAANALGELRAQFKFQ